MRRKIFPVWMALMLLFFPLVGGCGNDSLPGGSITWGLPHTPDILHPYLGNGEAKLVVRNLIYQGLCRYNQDLQIVPSLPAAETSADHTVWTFTLRDDVQWHDGKPFTAHDVAFTFGLHFREGSPIEFIEALARVRAVDDHTVRITLAESCNLLPTMTEPILPRHIFDPEVTYCVPISEMEDHRANFRPVGTGPFAFSHWETEEQPGKIVLARNPAYYDGKYRGAQVPFSQRFGLVCQLHQPGAAAAAKRKLYDCQPERAEDNPLSDPGDDSGGSSLYSSLLPGQYHLSPQQAAGRHHRPPAGAELC